jgi:pyrroloquinoline quinone (PQQ) biosynthesis protein C
MPSEHTVADNVIYDLVSVQYHALKGAEVSDKYIEDAHDHEDVVAFFRRVKEEDERRAQEAHDLLRSLTKEKGGIG